jgi:cyanophycinase
MTVLRQRVEQNSIVVAGTSAGAAIQSDPTFGEGRSYGYIFFNADLKWCSIGEELVDDREGTDSFRYQENGAFMKGFGFVQNVLVDTQ